MNKNKKQYMITYHPSISLMVISMSYKVIILTNINSSWMKTYNLTKPMEKLDWMVKNIKPSKKVLFWDVGIKEYDLEYIENGTNQNTRKSLIENKEENIDKSNTTFSTKVRKKDYVWSM